MNDLTRRQFIRLGAASGALAIGMHMTGCSGANHSPLKKDRNMSQNKKQNKSIEGKINPAELNEVTRLFEKMIKEGLHTGAQLCVYHQGEPMIELAGGLDSPGGRPVTAETLYQIRSTTKALTTIAMMMIYEKGRFAFEDPVAKHWPEFGARGKQSITIAQIMNHSAGIPDGPMIPIV